MAIEDLNPLGIIGGIMCGLLSVVIAGKMMPSLLIKILAFGISTVVGYMVVSKIFEQ